MKLFSIALVFLFVASGCGQKAVIQNNPKTQNVVENAVEIPFGESISRDDVTIKFIEVVEDSRCPTGVNCIWAGRAIVKVEVTANGKKEEKILIFGEVRPGEEQNNNLYNSSEFAINGITLNPYPTEGNSEEDANYVLIVSKEKTNN